MMKKHRYLLAFAAVFVGMLLLYFCVQRGQQESAEKKTGLAYHSLAEADGKAMGIVTGTILDKMTQKYLPHSPGIYYHTHVDCLNALQLGKIEGFLVDEPIARMMKQQNPGIDYLEEKVQPDFLAAGISKKRPELKAVIDAGLEGYRQDGTLAAMDTAWFSTDESLKVMPEHREGTKGTVVCGVAVTAAPMVYVRDGQLIGYEAALVQRILQNAGYTIELQNMDFSALIPSLASGKVDMIIGSISITEERKKSLLFTEPLYDSGIVLVVKNYDTALPEPGFWDSMKDGFYRNFILEDRYKMILDGLKVTLIITVFAALLGTILGFLVCILLKSQYAVVRWAMWGYIKVMQGTPLVVLLMILYYIVFGNHAIDPVIVAVFAFGINMAAYVSLMMRSGIDAVDPGQWEAAYAMGFNRTKTFLKIIAPQALHYVLPVYTGEFISLLKMTSVVGYIAIMDLTKMSDIIRSRTYEAFFPLIITAVIYMFAAWLLTAGFSYLEYRIDPKRRSRRLKGVKL